MVTLKLCPASSGVQVEVHEANRFFPPLFSDAIRLLLVSLAILTERDAKCVLFSIINIRQK